MILNQLKSFNRISKTVRPNFMSTKLNQIENNKNTIDQIKNNNNKMIELVELKIIRF